MKFTGVLLSVGLLLFLPLLAFSQEDDFSYSSERLFGVNINTNAGFLGGVYGKYSRIKHENRADFLSLDIVNVSHQQEIKVSSITTGNSYVYEKSNYFFVIRPTLGKEFLVFPAAREGGVQISTSLGGGISAGLLKPYFIKYDYSKEHDMSLVEQVPFDSRLHTVSYRILGHGGFFKGLNLIKFVPGLHFKGSVIFYFGSKGNRVSGLEAGFLAEGFFKAGNGEGLQRYKVPILSLAQNKWFFSTLFVNIFFGWRK